MTTLRRISRQLLSIGENRLELLGVELQEERVLLVTAVLLGLGLAVLGLLLGIVLSAAVAVLLWPWSPVGGLLLLVACYALAGAWCLRRLRGLLAGWQPLSATRKQLRDDRAGLERLLS